MAHYHVVSPTPPDLTTLPVVLIPAYQPDKTLVDLVTKLLEQSEQHDLPCPVVIVNDGSAAECTPLFSQLDSFPQVSVLHHDHNQGKGAALKTGMKWVVKNYPADCPGIITADADGQHLPHDILRLAQRLQSDPQKLWLGVRRFDDEQIPWRSRFGNNLTMKVFSCFTGQRISDTQTGLRGIPQQYIPALLAVHSDGYEFELDMLLQAKKNKISIAELEITTVYEPGNESSHFNPLLDSLRIYGRFIRFAGVGLLSAGLDYLLFSLTYWLSGEILMSIVLARVISGLFNFTCNRQFVFNGNNSIIHEASRYSALAVILVGLSFLITKACYLLGITPFIGKLIAEGGVFMLSFFAQRHLVFKDIPSAH